MKHSGMNIQLAEWAGSRWVTLYQCTVAACRVRCSGVHKVHIQNVESAKNTRIRVKMRAPVIGSIARETGKLSCTMRSSARPCVVQFSVFMPRSVETTTLSSRAAAAQNLSLSPQPFYPVPQVHPLCIFPREPGSVLLPEFPKRLCRSDLARWQGPCEERALPARCAVGNDTHPARGTAAGGQHGVLIPL